MVRTRARRRRLPSLLLLAPLWLAATDCSSDDGNPPDDVRVGLVQVASGLQFPLYLTAPAGDPRLFIVEKDGRVRIVKDGALLTEPFLDVTDLISDGGEQGLLGLAFHPRYATNGIFVVNYTDRAGDTRVVTYRVSTNADRADHASAQVVLPIDQPFGNHNGGHLAFGPDGQLYVGMGDGGSSGDPDGRGQARNDLLGSLLRVTIADNGTMTVPADNPFAGEAGIQPELWNYGLRNPWRFSFDRSTGDLYIADVGQGQYEEVNVVPASSDGGENYGWNIMEGRHCFEAGTCDQSGLTLPAFEYTHGDGCSVTGGYVYRGSAIPELRGHYFYSDFCAGWVRSFRWANNRVTDEREWDDLKPGGEVPSFGEDAQGELYVMNAGGSVYRVVRRDP